MPSEYHLEINEPGNDSCVAGTYESEKPFGSFHVGDTIAAISMNQNEHVNSVRITGIKHILWENKSNVKHKISISTEVAE